MNVQALWDHYPQLWTTMATPKPTWPGSRGRLKASWPGRIPRAGLVIRMYIGTIQKHRGLPIISGRSHGK